MKNFNDDNYCFVCGKENPNGLQLTFEYVPESDEVVSTAMFPKHFQGWADVLHGGIMSTVLDEIMVKAAGQKGFATVTAQLTVNFKQPAHTDTQYTFKGKVTEIRGKLIFTEASVHDDSNALIAKGTAKLFKI